MKTKIITKIAKCIYVGTLIVTTPLWIILAVADMGAAEKGVYEGFNVIKKICKQ